MLYPIKCNALSHQVQCSISASAIFYPIKCNIHRLYKKKEEILLVKTES